MIASSALNPFVAGGAVGGVDGRGFVGREDIFSFVQSALNVERRAPILLYGQRRMGKSSILKQIPRRLSRESCFVYFDLQGTAAMKTEQVLYGLGLAVADRLSIEPPERENCTEQLFPLMFGRALEKLGGREEKLVLLFDEFDVIDRPVNTGAAGTDFIPCLARFLEHFPGIGCILVMGRKTEELSPAALGLLLRNAITKEIGRLTETQVVSLARELAAGSLDFDDESLRKVYAIAAGHPFCTQALFNVIWTLAMTGDPALPVRVTSSTVDAALPEAMEVWANGLNWVYDGMSKPGHRLLLSALAEVANPLAGESSSLDGLDKFLRSRHTSPDPHQFAAAANELLKWDVLSGELARLTFSVPMIGAWIARNRSLAVLRGEAVVANPRSRRYYELALESLERNDYDEAIGDFRNALNASPDSLDVMRGLARALALRRKPGDLAAAADVYEKTIGLEPGEPRSPLLEALSGRIDEGGRVDAVCAAFRRIAELDPGGAFEQKAKKRIAKAAEAHETRGSDGDRKIAESLFSAIGDTTGARRARGALKRRRIVRIVLFSLVIACILGGIIELNLPTKPKSFDLRGLFYSLLSFFSALTFGIMFLISLDRGAIRDRWIRNLISAVAGGVIGIFAIRSSSDSLLSGCAVLVITARLMLGLFIKSPPADTGITPR